MSYVHTGKLHKLEDAATSKGRKYLRVVLTKEGYQGREDLLALDVWKDTVIERFRAFNPGDEIKVEFDINSREYGGKWFTGANAFKVMLVRAAGTTTTAREETPPSESDDPLDGIPF